MDWLREILQRERLHEDDTFILFADRPENLDPGLERWGERLLGASFFIALALLVNIAVGQWLRTLWAPPEILAQIVWTLVAIVLAANVALIGLLTDLARRAFTRRQVAWDLIWKVSEEAIGAVCHLEGDQIPSSWEDIPVKNRILRPLDFAAELGWSNPDKGGARNSTVRSVAVKGATDEFEIRNYRDKTTHENVLKVKTKGAYSPQVVFRPENGLYFQTEFDELLSKERSEARGQAGRLAATLGSATAAVYAAIAFAAKISS